MSFYDLFQEEPFKTVFNEVEEFTKRKLVGYNDYLEEIKLSSRSKEIFDAVWGNIEFSSGEIYILDSPLLQRLRNIKQLGLAYFVYCGSDYSRFSHTIGVVFLADRMAASLNKCDIGSEKEKNYFKAVVRLAAIFHDAGHMFLSHVSEHYFAKSSLYPRYEMIDSILEEFERRVRKSVSLHELLGCMMVNTPEVKRLLKCVKDELNGGILLKDDADVDKLVEYISSLIVGVPVDRDVLPYSSIINGPIDADKCDYLSRDSHVTRVPVAVDISRLTQKINVVISKEINTSELWHTESSTSKPYYELAMSDSAEKALFQLCIARTIMFDSVYYHHKVLTAETELRSLINKLAHLEEPLFTSFLEILEYSDTDFNHYFFEQIASCRKDKDIAAIKKIQKEWEEIYARNMAKRIACIMPEFLLGTQSAREEFIEGALTRLNSPQEEELLDNLREEYQKICILLDGHNGDDNNTFIIQSPMNVYGHSKIQVPIHLYNGEKREFRGYELVNSRETSSSASYVVTNAKNKNWMYLALEKVLYREYHILLKSECSACGKFNREEEGRYFRKLLEKGYYDETPELIRDFFLLHYLSETQIQDIKDKFSKYEGPDGYTVGEKEIYSFFKQIISACNKKNQVREIIKGIYHLLMNAIFIDRKFAVENITAALGNINIENNELVVVPLGGLKDSGKHIAYYFNDVHLMEKRIITKDSLQDVLEEGKNNTVIFFDDGSYSGNQVISIMQDYMGITEGRTTTESHVDELSEPHKEQFKNMTVYFFFLLFNSAKQQNTEDVLNKMGLKNTRFIYSKDMSWKIFERADLFDNEEQKKLVKEFLQNVGVDIMDSLKRTGDKYKERWDEKRVQEAALGYNDAQQMVFLESSVPTYTIIPFWQAGRYSKFDWHPLFRRTKKEDK